MDPIIYFVIFQFSNYGGKSTVTAAAPWIKLNFCNFARIPLWCRQFFNWRPACQCRHNQHNSSQSAWSFFNSSQRVMGKSVFKSSLLCARLWVCSSSRLNSSGMWSTMTAVVLLTSQNLWDFALCLKWCKILCDSRLAFRNNHTWFSRNSFLLATSFFRCWTPSEMAAFRFRSSVLLASNSAFHFNKLSSSGRLNS